LVQLGSQHPVHVCSTKLLLAGMSQPLIISRTMHVAGWLFAHGNSQQHAVLVGFLP
jgi:hypothetical protein